MLDTCTFLMAADPELYLLLGAFPRDSTSGRWQIHRLHSFLTTHCTKQADLLTPLPSAQGPSALQWRIPLALVLLSAKASLRP